ncbi:MAG: two-component sensor histidine kinase [Sphingomonas sanxanigenens]|uniref:histidine kinase n=1 Tax=Sphingomonas sanxanigenens TaxID=397260 RepID=A0A2W4ZZJ2_9SPHN|nr:MAG: two-component sensor histidine kinase [Sphingomonas sanxanigenens]
MTLGSNLSLRISAILLCGFVIFQALVWGLLSLPSRGDENRPYNLPLPAQARIMAETLEHEPAARRAMLLDTMNGSLYTLRLTRDPQMRPDSDDLADLRARYVAAMPGRTIGLSGRRPLLGRFVGARPWPGRFFAPITLTVSLADGSRLLIDSRPSSVVRTYLRQRAFLGATSGLLLLAILAFAVRQTTRPLVRLSRGVRSFATNLQTPDLPLRGSRELRDLSAAFNDMKARIGTLMAERTRMLAGIAHDMRTYLTRLRLRAEFIDDPDQRARATRDLDEMSALLDDTLLFASREAADPPKPALIDVAKALDAVAAIRAETGAAVALEPVPPGLRISAVPIAFRRIVDNLIDNGLRHGEHVRLAAEGGADGKSVVVRISDDGPGVPAAALARLGEPFGRVDPSRDRTTGGAGLGLAIVKALAERDGGKVQFANGAVSGFVVQVEYPAAAGHMEGRRPT